MRGPYIRVFPRISDSYGIGLPGQLPDKGILYGFLDDDARACRTDLALVEENADHGPLGCCIQVGIRENDIRGFTAEFEPQLFTFTAAERISDWPTFVKMSAYRRQGSPQNAPTSPPPKTRFAAPAGILPFKYFKSLIVESGALELGFMTILFPAARGRHFQTPIRSG